MVGGGSLGFGDAGSSANALAASRASEHSESVSSSVSGAAPLRAGCEGEEGEEGASALWLLRLVMFRFESSCWMEEFGEDSAVPLLLARGERGGGGFFRRDWGVPSSPEDEQAESEE
jgi:hypothetical protein